MLEFLRVGVGVCVAVGGITYGLRNVVWAIREPESKHTKHFRSQYAIMNLVFVGLFVGILAYEFTA